MLGALTLYPKLVGYLLQTTVERVSVKETLDVKQVGEEEFQDFVELVAVGGKWLVG